MIAFFFSMVGNKSDMANPYIFSQQMAYIFEKFPWLVMDNNQPRNNVFIDDGTISEERTLLRDEPNDQFLSMFRLYTEEVKNRKRKADKDGPEVEATLNIHNVNINIVTFWSMSDPCSDLEEGECVRNPLCEFQGGVCSKKLTKEAIDVYVREQIRAQTGYLNALARFYEVGEEVEVNDVVDCWLCNLHSVNGIQELLDAANDRVRNIQEEENEGNEDLDVAMYAMALGVDRDEIKSILYDPRTVTWDVESDVVIVQDESGNKYRAISDLEEDGDFEAALVSGVYEEDSVGGDDQDSVGGEEEDDDEEDGEEEEEEEGSVGEDGEEKDGEDEEEEGSVWAEEDQDFNFDPDFDSQNKSLRDMLAEVDLPDLLTGRDGEDRRDVLDKED